MCPRSNTPSRTTTSISNISNISSNNRRLRSSNNNSSSSSSSNNNINNTKARIFHDGRVSKMATTYPSSAKPAPNPVPTSCS